MSKDKSDAEKKARKEEKKKRKLAETAEVEEPVAKKEKKDKKKKAAEAEASLIDDSAMQVDGDSDAEQPVTALVAAGASEVPLAALVPFANPLADDKQQKKVLKGVKKGKSLFFRVSRRDAPTASSSLTNCLV